MSQYDLTIVFPVYNESRRIDLHKERVKNLNFEYSVQIVYVNDGSVDGCFEMMRQDLAADHVKFVENPRNLGKGGAVRTGVQASDGRYVLFTDFDVPVTPETFKGIFQQIHGKDQTAVIGVRKKTSEVENSENRTRKYLSWGFQSFLKWVIGIQVTDSQCGFKIFDNKSGKEIFSRMKTNGFAFDVEMLLLARKLGVKVEEFPVVILEDCGPSTINIFIDPLKMVVEILKIRWRLFFAKI
ncbi:MAG: glycosyltransferase [Deltaproteobacteria bacterium]|nr:MAG: glycosyltransferase [Deltaproteobacteria bacterium]